MEIKNIGQLKNDVSINAEDMGKDPKADITTLQQVFENELKVGKYTFRIKQLKGKDLFNLVNTFGFSGTTVNVETDENGEPIINQNTLEQVFMSFGKSFDFAMKHIEFKINNGKFGDLVANGIYQVPEVETNVSLMYRLLFFIYQAIQLFMAISQRQLDDMN